MFEASRAPAGGMTSKGLLAEYQAVADEEGLEFTEPCADEVGPQTLDMCRRRGVAIGLLTMLATLVVLATTGVLAIGAQRRRAARARHRLELEERAEVATASAQRLAATNAGGDGCEGAGCNLTLGYDRNSSADAQLLIQATFGPTRASLAELQGAASYADWIQAQIDLPATSHREYYRTRTNGRLTGRPAGPRPPCEAGSRWHAFAIGAADKGKPVSVAGNKLRIDGELRTDIDPHYSGNGLSAPLSCTDEGLQRMINQGKPCREHVRNRWSQNCAGGSSAWTGQEACRQTCYDVGHGYPGDDCSPGWASLAFKGYVCEVEEEVGGWVALSATPECDASAVTGHENPAIWFASPPEVPQQLPAFKELKPGVLLLSETIAPPCTLAQFILRSGQYYIHDSRMLLVRNDLISPFAGGAAVCPAVAKTFLNEASCQVQPTCNSVELTSASLTLNQTSFQLFFDVAEKYVYSIAGLRTTSSPCGALSRWQKLATRPPSVTVLSETDRQAVKSALQAEEGWLRDVYVPCVAVPASAVVEIGGDTFQHVHINEHNVYDFSAWVARHPGGQSHIKAPASQGFQVEFPPSHPMSRWTGSDAGVNAQVELGFVGRLGDAVDFLMLPAGLQTRELALALGAGKSIVGFQACGSPGEVANDPGEGHHFSFSVDEDGKVWDTNYDYPYIRGVQRQLSRGTVWTNIALRASDQLRQRVAWALSQILVVSTAGSNAGGSNEVWVNYYDIFVRNAFGNYRDILREVTHSPMMAEFLSFRNSKSLDTGGGYPDENYAREIMQLFTVGLWELHPDGTRKLDADGAAILTYSNDHIMDFARVFTGFTNQPMRANIESHKGERNVVDPMQMRADWHDVYPKPDLDGGYLGDGYPLCADLPARAFLSKGARYEFLGYDHTDAGVLVAGTESGLYGALLNFRSVVVLGASLDCHGAECSTDNLKVVKVAEGYYEYVPPVCVHLYFFNGQAIAPGGNNFHKTWKHKCADPGTLVAGASCCDGCTNKPSLWLRDNNYTCEDSPSPALDNNCRNKGSWANHKYCQLACWARGLGYDGDNCSRGAFVHARSCEKLRFSAATAACARLGLQVCELQTPTGSCGLDEAFVWTPEPCAVSVEVRDDGTVSSQMDSKSKQNKISVQWHGGHPTRDSCPDGCTASASGCVCPGSVEARAVFGELPGKEELLRRLKIGAHPPGGGHSCLAPCAGDVRAYVQDAVIDAATIFECQGAYFKNEESVVDVGGFTFRNPPVFMLAEALAGSQDPREALSEVESLLDHLFRHPNTPPFLAHRLIQRLVTSNPTPEYVHDVALAFRQGQFGGVEYSGRYGDLRAAVAAILLHPEARGQRPEAPAGKLREPMIKIAHFMRAMEYQGAKDRQDVLRDLQDVIGQFPYEAPSVFNFYTAEFQPAGFPGGMVAPEFEIFTPPLALGWVNGMLSLVQTGLSHCGGGFSVSIQSCNVPEGGITLGFENSSLMLEELSLLLTGGRLSGTDAVRAAYEAFTGIDPVPAALRAILMSAEFHTLGAPEPAGPRPEQQDKVLPEPRSYKAMVMLYLAGGADTFNLLVPLCTDLYAEYVAVRQDVALPKSKLSGITASTQACTDFGVHHSLPFVARLYGEDQLAFLSNVGSLVEPTTKEQYKSKASRNCAGLFSHVDQVYGAQTLQCQVQGASPRGFGGRLADTLEADGYLTASFSIAGTATFSQGLTTSVEIVSGSAGVVQMQGYEELQTVVGNITKTKYRSIYAEEYVSQFAQAVRSSQALGSYLDEVALTTAYDTSTGLAKQMEQVARLIATREARKVERDFFFVQLGGFDTHSDVMEVLEEKFGELDAALEGFVGELRGQGVFDSVVLVASSEFGRTLTSNTGEGTDHAWAGNYFVLGGGVRGGRVFNDFPQSLAEGNDQDAGRGRLIPRYPWESIMVPVAEWMGADPASEAFSRVFPNLGNFDRSKHIVGLSDLFSSYDLV